MNPERIVVIGAGHSGVQLAASLREGGFQGPLTLVDAQDELPYQRPPLSKEFMKGGDCVRLRPASFYIDKQIELATGRAVATLDRAATTVTLSDGTTLRYDHLVLATGARPRRLAVPGAGNNGVMTLHTHADAARLRPRLAGASDIVIVGAGFIGLEFASSARAMGKRVTVVEAGDRIMARAVSPIMSDFFLARHRASGIDIMTGTGVTAIHGTPGGVTGVSLGGGGMLPADLVVLGVGVVANDEIAAGAGLKTDNGIAVDAMLRTADPRISAIGDCALHPSRFTGRPTRIESVQNALDQARCVARRLLGEPAPYEALPWFWSDQAGVKLQIAGIGGEIRDHCLRGDPEARSFSVFCLDARDEAVIVESVNQPADHMSSRRFLGRAPLTRAQAMDPHYNLRTHV
ncbi:FAD-dependent oxidoreductase [Bosea sp. (in: a-proteobacteria)]|uniref:NAD(P)/FAD-dependent oxidoreductase n=1 Tax=Bosea sp. (in: a-proteobacteria) TaxID=1871050 RepID=UPI002618E2C9|nr:FAD-dependent oxidoreductase [Bosea sp. (in: a-proteobacteria)]MCO5089838.1 FAD-dependent oxidoreductase [Bosea sp. (in: a-proteobacteria)]